MDKEVKELKNGDHYTTLIATIKSEVLTAVKEYLGTSLGDALHKNRNPDDDDRDKDPPAGTDQGLKKRKTSDDAQSSKRSKSTGSSKDTTCSQPKLTDKSVQSEETVFEAADTEMPLNQGDDMGNTNAQPNVETWLNDLANAEKTPLSFNELMRTPIYFSAFAMNRLKISNLTKADLVGPVYNHLKRTCKSYVELEYNMEECRLTVPVDFFFNNGLEYLRGRNTDRKYTASKTKTKAAKKSRHDVYSTMRILSLTSITVKKWYGYGYLKVIIVRRADQKLYKLIDGDFSRLHLNDIEDMLLLVAQNKLNNLAGDVIVHLAFSRDLKIFIWEAPYTTLSDPQGVIYEYKLKRKRLMHTEELYKFSDGTLTLVYFVMSDLEDSTVTYKEVSSPFEDLSDIGSLRAIVHRYDGLPMMPEDVYAYVEAALQAPPSPDYVSGLEEPEQAPPSPDFVLEPVYPEFMPPEDDVLPAEEQPLPAAVSPCDSPGFILSQFLDGSGGDVDEDPEEDPANYPTDRDDDDEEEEEESSRDDVDDKEEDEDEEEEEHLAPADSVPPPACHTTARMSIRDQTSISFPSAAEVDRFLAISTPPPSPLTSYSLPLPQIPSPPLPVSSPLPMSPPPLPASPTHPLGYRAAMIRLRAELPSTSHPLLLPSPIVLPHTRASIAMMRAAAPSTFILASRSETPPLLPIPLPTSSPHLLLPSTDCRADVPEVGESSSAPTARPNGGFRADYGFVGTLDADIRRDLEKEIGYGITDIWEDPYEIVEEIPATGRVQSMDASDTARSEVRALRTIVLAQQTEIRDLWAADRRRETQLTEALTLLRTLQTQMAALQS
ncbi:hypothetical protein Tco_1509297 [Tanacetum coccineum]